MTSVRLRLLILALLPLVVLMPLLLWFAVNRWAANYDNLLTANVESDLRIAEQYLGQILTTTGRDVQALANSTRFASAASRSDNAFATFLKDERDTLGLDFLHYLPRETAMIEPQSWPVIANALQRCSITRMDIFSGAKLSEIDPGISARAR